MIIDRLPDDLRIDVSMTVGEASSAQKALGAQAAIMRISDAAAARRVEHARKALDKALRAAKKQLSARATL